MDPSDSADDGALLVPGDTCWRSAKADRFATIIDGADYLRHVKAAMLEVLAIGSS